MIYGNNVWPKRVALLLAFVLVLIFFLQPKPKLLDGVDYSTAIYDSQHQLLRVTLTQDGQYRLFTPLSAISPLIIQATLLKEDRGFYKHQGVDFPAVVNAFWETYIKHHYRRGGSTLTMQVVRLNYHLNTHTWWGKLRQMILAIQLERYYSKQEILQAYFNLAPYGNNIQGIGAASLIYYHSRAADLNLPQALTLSVIPQNPGKRSLNQLDYAWIKTARTSLFQHWLQQSPQDKKFSALVNLPLVNFTRHQLPFLAPHFVNQVLQTNSIESTEVITTLNLRWQNLIEHAIKQYVATHRDQGVHNAAVLLVDTHDMSVKALVGSADFFDKNSDGQVNGTSAPRSPGSALKPFIYALAIDQGLIHPGSVLKDAPMSFGNYDPENFDRDFLGPVTAKDALIMSRNIPAIDLANQLKTPNFYQFLLQSGMSLRPEQEYGLALVLGGAEITMQQLAELYAMLANQGVYRPLRFLGDDKLDSGKRLLSPEASFLVLDMLQDNPRPKQWQGYDHTLPVSWKTGTSSGYRDAWAVGVFSHYVLAVWVGNFSGSGNPAFTGRDAAGLLFFNIIDMLNPVLPTLTPVTAGWPQLNLKKVAVCKASGLLPTPACPHTVLTWFIPGKSPIRKDTIYREVMINPQTGLRACHFNPHNTFAVYEFWPSDIVKIFQQAGIARRLPPPYEPGCDLTDKNLRGAVPQITSPKAVFNYVILPNHPTVQIPLTAIVDADVQTLYWFVDQNYLGKTNRGQVLWWNAKPGHSIIRVVDDYSRTNSIELTVIESM